MIFKFFYRVCVQCFSLLATHADHWSTYVHTYQIYNIQSSGKVTIEAKKDFQVTKVNQSSRLRHMSLSTGSQGLLIPTMQVKRIGPFKKSSSGKPMGEKCTTRPETRLLKISSGGSPNGSPVSLKNNPVICIITFFV